MRRFSKSAFAVFFKQLPKLLLAGLLFAAFLDFFMSLSIAAGKISGFYNVIVCGLGLIPASLFLPGLVIVVRKYGVEKKFVPVIPTFFSAVRSNLKQFILHGFVIYLIVACSTFAIIYYGIGALGSSVYSMIFIIYVLFTLVLTIALFYLILMAVTYELRLRDLYKNAILLVFGTILRNICALLYAAAVGAAALLAIVYTSGVWRYIAAAVVSVLCPLLLSYGVTAIISKGMQDNVGPFVGVKPEKKKSEITDEEQELANSISTGGEYVFVNGKMIKNSDKGDNTQ